MTIQQITSQIKARYQIGQVINARHRDKKGNITDRFKVEILKFYPYHVACMVGKVRESFTYCDMLRMTRRGKAQQWNYNRRGVGDIAK
jgi:hypothetical protein